MKGKNDQKVYYTIKEVCNILDIKAYTLRNWEAVIPFLNPKKNKFGHRIYSSNDIEKIKMIKTLLYENKYTIKGVIDLFITYNGDISKANLFPREKKHSDSSKNKLWGEIKKQKEIIKKMIDKNS